MPHKHKRKRDENDAAEFDLPPTARAAALPVNKPKAVVTNDDDDSQPKRSNKRRKPSRPKTAQQGKMIDDTPKQFARLMAFAQGKKLRKGLDDGVPRSKERKKPRKAPATATDEATADATHTSESTPQLPPSSSTTAADSALKIQPGERLSDFALRVDQSLPLSQVPKHSTRAPAIAGVREKTYLTKHNKRLARMQAQWREVEAKLKEREEERDEERLDQKEEEGLLWMDVEEARLGKKGKKKRAERDGDIWGELVKKRREESGGDGGVVGGPGGLNAKTAVQAPPVLKRVKNMFKEKGWGGVGRNEVLARE